MTKKKRNAIISISIIIVLLLIITIPLVWVEVANNPKFYTEEQHIRKISKKIDKIYMNNNSYKFVSYEILPLYTEKDELGYFLVEFEPYGYLVVKLIDPLYIQKLAFGSMYKKGNYIEGYWTPYKCYEGEKLYFPNETIDNAYKYLKKDFDNRFELGYNYFAYTNHKYDDGTLYWEYGTDYEYILMDKEMNIWILDKNKNSWYLGQNDTFFRTDERGCKLEIDNQNRNWLTNEQESKFRVDECGRLCEFGENGDFVKYKKSYYAVANIQTERRYLLEVGDDLFIPAIRKDDKYLNLISMEEMSCDIHNNIAKYPIVDDLNFSGDPHELL